jgi:hypothetical protein
MCVQIARQGGGLRAYNYPIMVIGPEDPSGWCIVIGLRSNLLAKDAQVCLQQHQQAGCCPSVYTISVLFVTIALVTGTVSADLLLPLQKISAV